MHVLGLIVLFLFITIGMALCLVALPGPLVIFFGALLYRAITDNTDVSVWFLAVLCTIGVVCEVLEYFSGVVGARRFGASRRALWGALGGGMAGAVVGWFTFPVIGSLAGGIAGAFVGAFAAEYGKRKEAAGSFRAGVGTVAGRLVAMLVKAAVAVGMIIAILFQVF